MIIALLILIILALLFPRLLRALVFVFCLGFIYVLFAGNSKEQSTSVQAGSASTPTAEPKHADGLSRMSDPLDTPSKSSFSQTEDIPIPPDDLFPAYDPERYCDQLAARNSRNSASTRHVCIDNEQDGYESLHAEWDEATMAERKKAIAMVAGTPAYGGGSYAALAAYIHGMVMRDRQIRANHLLQERNHFHP